jgi:hypothetical protein
MEINISQEAWDRYLNKEEVANNSRLRPENEDIFDAMLSVDMNTPERQEMLKLIKELD